jgi:23S rRNA (guanosine2251-2'-O)-methyltransferase
MERVPFQVTLAATPYESIGRLPVDLMLENVRSLYNVGSFFRTADAAGAAKLWLCGITGCPPAPAITKTALGADKTTPWEFRTEAVSALDLLRHSGYELAAVETSVHAVDLFDWAPRFPVCVVFGNEVEGVSPGAAAMCDTHVRIPMRGVKHSLNVSTAGGVVLYELLRKYRAMAGGR